MTFSESTFDKPDVMNLTEEPLPCQVCGDTVEENDCPMGTFCEDCHGDLNISGCRSDDCWAYDFTDHES